MDHIRSWIFDLDNTLYPARAGLFDQVERRMMAFVCRHLAIAEAAAVPLRRRWIAEHGTTLRGLMVEHRLEPAAFLDFVHDIDLAPLAPDPALDAALAALPGRKLVFTNGTVAYAGRVLRHLGLERHFEAVFDIEGCGWVPKPDPAGYRTLIGRYGVVPAETAMVEDIARNLEPAHALGMTTVWVRPPGDEAAAAAHVHHMTDDLPTWLAALRR